MSKNIVVVHPDLGIGGAERLIVDFSKALQQLGHSVRIYTGYHDPKRCFQETRDGTLKIHTVGSWIPRSIFGGCHALMAYLRMMYIALHLILFSKQDIVVCDQVSACIPIFKLDFRSRPKIIFYCHFPDQLLTQRDTLLKNLYRKVLDRFEEWTTSLADIILVNSKFTRNVVTQTFKSLKSRELQILYPCVDLDNFTPIDLKTNNSTSVIQELAKDNFIFLSLNRFEKKKNLRLAIDAFYECKNCLEERDEGKQPFKAHLVIAGGFDKRLPECVSTLEELDGVKSGMKMDSDVTFVLSPNDCDKLALIQLSNAVLYTPTNEHFGIVPLEAMAMSKPVIACASGGPLETIEDDVTGILCESERHSFADAMLSLYNGDKSSSDMGKAGYRRVKERFSFEAFRDRLKEICFPSD